MIEQDTFCECCGRFDQEHSFAELMHCLYADAGLTRKQADGIIDRITAEVVDPRGANRDRGGHAPD